MESKSKNILLVVDNWERLERYSDALDKHFITTEAPFPSEGLRFAQSTIYDFIVLDLTMGDMNSIEFIENLNAPEAVYFVIDNDEELSHFHLLTDKVTLINRKNELNEILKQIILRGKE